jgi:transcriptional regulator with PAS, ATPase and Fis domain
VRELQNIIERAVITSQRGSFHFVLPDDSGIKPTTLSSRVKKNEHQETGRIMPK